MYKPKAFSKTQRSLTEIVIIVLLLAILMMCFIHYFFKQEDKLTQVALHRITQSFSTKVTAVHAQWFMDKQPSTVQVAIGGVKQPVTVNSKGWVDTADKELVCAKIWNIIIMEPMNLMNSPISAVEVKEHNMKIGRICRFELPSGEYFEYNSQNGKVGGVLSRDKSL